MMKKKITISLLLLGCVGFIALTLLFLATQNIPVLQPKGMIALKEKKLLIDASLIMLIVVVPVFILMFAFAWKYRESNTKSKYTPHSEHNHVAEALWWGIPIVIIIFLAILTWKSSHDLDPYKPLESNRKPVKIQVVALTWKWLFIYPEQGIATVNLIKFPEHTPVDFEITADAPMNSFWIPALGGQIYAMPAMRTQLHLIANEVGTFRGGSAHLSGEGFAGMTFSVQATTEAEFQQWIKEVKMSGKQLRSGEYEALVAPSKNNPVALYSSVQPHLFDEIIMKYKSSGK